MANMPIQYLQTPEQDSHGHQSFTNAYSFPPYSLTPYSTTLETEEWSSFSFETWVNSVHEVERRAETSFNAPSASSLCHSSSTSSLNISSIELQRVLDSLLNQVDWLKVIEKVARNRAASIYYNAIKNILLAHIYQLVKIEGEDDDAARLENGNEDENYVYEGDDEEEGENESEPISESEDKDEDGDEDEDEDGKNEDMEGDEDEDENDNMNNDEYDEDSEPEYKE